MNIKIPFLALVTFASVSAHAGEITLKDCPAAVQQTLQANSRSAPLDEIEMIKIEGHTRYVAEYDLPNDKSLKVYVDGDGKLLKTKEELTAAELPASVSDAAQKLVPTGGKISDVDREVAGGKTTYLVEIDRPSAPDLDVVLAEDGGILSRKEEVQD